jgi:two-component system sensor histidine kinase/response regulator
MVTAYGRDEALQAAERRGVGSSRADQAGDGVGPAETFSQALGNEASRWKRRAQVVQRESREGALQAARLALLLVEDNDMNQELAMELLSGAGVDVGAGGQRPGGARHAGRARPFDGC